MWGTSRDRAPQKQLIQPGIWQDVLGSHLCIFSTPWLPARPQSAVLSAVLFFSEEKDTGTGPEGQFAKESASVPAEDAGGSEPSDEEAATPSAESRDAADEDTPDPAARAQERELIFDAATPATPQEPTPQEDSVDLLGLNSEAGLAPPMQACGAAPSTADLLSRLLGAPDPAPEVPPGDLLGGETPLLFSSPAPSLSAQSPPREGPAAVGTLLHPAWE